MGVLISLVAATKTGIKRTREKRREKKRGTAEQVIQRGLAEEHLATVAPDVNQLQTEGGARRGNEGGDTAVLTADPTGQDQPQTSETTTLPTTTTTTQQHQALSSRSRNPTKKMATDEDYMAFLDKANQDPNEGYTKPQNISQAQFKATDDGADIPPILKTATKDAWYTSEADEKFEVVCLRLKAKKGLPDEASFANLIIHPNPSQAEIQILDIAEWDPRGEYKSIVDAVREASKGSDVRVYRVGKGGARFEYWVVGVDGKEARLVGVKVLAVES